MADKKKSHANAETAFELILYQWQNDFEFRETFRKDPEKAIKDAGIDVSADELAKIRAKLKLDRNKNDKLDERESK